MRVQCCVVLCCAMLAVLGVATAARRLRQLSAGVTRCNSNHHTPLPAKLQQLQQRVLQAELVFTGKVLSEFDINEDFNNENAVYGEHRVKGDYRGFWVRVKRVLKGDLYAGGSKPVHVQLLVGKVEESDSEKYAHICYSVIRVHHTAIFLAKRSTYLDNRTTSVSLESSADPLPITLWNLDHVNAIVTDMTYKPRPPLSEEACEKKYCPWGSNCVKEADGETALCVCPTDCPPDSAGPVCGTDDVTYENQCLVKRKACLQQDTTRVRHSGECGAPSRRPA